ncbi:hypothetical protein LCGC14_0417100 [marine sediment metagenome]|uniref:Uncharacterized protein n=1 Tax=marine sediment metagenome TaxID=412755 RepID=A0A0F9VE73_9ZZZZ
MEPGKKITDEIREKLRAPFPPEAITDHPTKTYLSTIKAAYVMERLNDVFGICGWEIEHEVVSDTDEYVTVKGCIHLTEFNLRTSEQYGGHGKTGKNTEPADGYKSAVTDLMSKCASYLEIGIDVFKGLKGIQKKQQVGKPAAPIPPKDKSSLTQKSEAPTNSKVDEVLQYIADKMKFNNTGTARQWLEKSMKIATGRIDSEPEAVLKEVADLQGWNL